MPQIRTNQREKAYMILQEDAESIRRLIEVQIDNFSMPQCPLYEEVLDTQMYGLSREINFAVRLDLISEKEGRQILEDLEQKLTVLHDAASKNKTKKSFLNSRQSK